MKKQNRKGRQLNLVVSPVELKLWRARAKASDMTLSAWLRLVANNGEIYTTTINKTNQIKERVRR